MERHIGEDEVVQHGDAQQLASALQPFGDIAVIIARNEVPAGVVVGDDDRGGPLAQRVGEDLMWMYKSIDFDAEKEANMQYVVDANENTQEYCIRHEINSENFLILKQLSPNILFVIERAQFCCRWC